MQQTKELPNQTTSRRFLSVQQVAMLLFEAGSKQRKGTLALSDGSYLRPRVRPGHTH